MAKYKVKRLHNIYSNMKQRCYNKNRKDYDRYGGLGIRICQEWLNSYNAFEEWALCNGYNETLTIDRIDSKGDYSPLNCRWATIKEQANNRKSVHHAIIDGIDYSLGELAEKFDMPIGTIEARWRAGRRGLDLVYKGNILKLDYERGTQNYVRNNKGRYCSKEK